MKNESIKMLEKFQKFLDLCKFCPNLCLDRCPVLLGEGISTFSPFGKMNILCLIKEGIIPLNSGTALTFYKCTGCLSCYEACLHKVNVEETLFNARRIAVSKNIQPFDIQNFIHDENENLKFLKKIVQKKYWNEELQVLYFPGCNAIEKTPEVIKNTFSVLNLLDMEFLGVGEVSSFCCGYPLYAAGYYEEFFDLANKVSKKLKKYKRIVCASSCCAYTFRSIYPSTGIDFLPPVRMSYEVIGSVILRLDITRLNKKIIYHDCCFTGRHLGDYEMPREIINYVTKGGILELFRNKKDSLCCGWGGVYKETSPEGAKISAKNLISATQNTAGEVLVTTSSSCLSHIRESISKDGFKIIDIISLIYEVIKNNAR